MVGGHYGRPFWILIIQSLFLSLFSHKFSLAAIVASVSPSCTKILASSAISSIVKLHAMAFASAVTALVSSSEYAFFNVLRFPHSFLFDAWCQTDAGVGRKVNKSSRDDCLY